MKNLVIVPAGDSSLHETYALDRDFELWVCYWGDDDTVAERFQGNCDRFFRIKGQKWALVRELGRIVRKQGLVRFSDYDYVLLPDDDIEFEGGSADLSGAFALAAETRADIFQPAIANEYYSKGWEATRRVRDAVCHATTIVEIMMPGYTGEIFERCVLPLLHIRGYAPVGWGIEPLIVRFAETVHNRPIRTFVLDEMPAVHTRPVGAGASAYSAGMDESFLNPFVAGIKSKVLAQFQSSQDARQYVFEESDKFIDWRAVEKHKKRVRGARRIHDLARKGGLPGLIPKMLQRLAYLYPKE
jgi:hypothetical protein